MPRFANSSISNRYSDKLKEVSSLSKFDEKDDFQFLDEVELNRNDVKKRPLNPPRSITVASHNLLSSKILYKTKQTLQKTKAKTKTKIMVNKRGKQSPQVTNNKNRQQRVFPNRKNQKSMLLLHERSHSTGQKDALQSFDNSASSPISQDQMDTPKTTKRYSPSSRRKRPQAQKNHQEHQISHHDHYRTFQNPFLLMANKFKPINQMQPTNDKGNKDLEIKQQQTLYPLPESVITRALAIDTRAIPTFFGDASSKKYFNACIDFLKKAERRGLFPIYLSASTINCSEYDYKHNKITKNNALTKSNDNRNLPSTDNENDNSKDYIHCEKVVTDESVRVRIMCIEEALNTKMNSCTYNNHRRPTWEVSLERVIVANKVMNLKKDRYECHLDQNNEDDYAKSKYVSALQTWMHFADLVDAIIKEAFDTSKASFQGDKHIQTNPPINVTIFTNNVTFFSDNHHTSHREGLDKFWNRMQNHFENRFLSSISVTIIEDEGVYSVNKCNSTFSSSTMKSYHALQEHLKHLHERSTLRKIQNPNSHSSQTINIILNLVQNHHIKLTNILRKWIRQALPNTNITLPLPEILQDDSQCTLILTMEYAVLPSSIRSVHTWNMIQHSKKMEQSDWEVMNVISMENVNASLIFGVSMYVKAGIMGEGDGSDFEEYKEMQLLAEQLWKYMSKKDVALLLRSHHENYFKHGENDDYYILMVETAVESAKLNDKNFKIELGGSRKIVSQGVLFRYAVDSQLVWDNRYDGEYDSINNHAGDNLVEETTAQYYDFIENSLDLLEGGDFNPLTIGYNEKRRQKSLESNEYYSDKVGQIDVRKARIDDNNSKMAIINKERKRWEEDGGVGVASTSLNQVDEQNSIQEVFDFTDGLEIFEYT